MVTHVLRVYSVHEDMSLERRIRSIWELESLQILEDENLVPTQFSDHVKFDNGNYVVFLPWKDLHFSCFITISFVYFNSLVCLSA
uniref:Uncharacterized protein n=1 Tax=Amphimedon queenslandica TaxID=400682 RepID=A0A1X7U5B2_AMPQE